MKHTRNEGTLLEFSKGLSAEKIKERDSLLITCQQLSVIQHNMMKRIEAILNEQGGFKFEIKHNHKQIQAMIKKNCRMLYDKMSYEAMDMYVDDIDKLADAISAATGIDADVLRY